MLSDEQFKELLSTICNRGEDHDLLIEIKTIVSQRSDDAIKTDKSVLGAHRRIDYLMVGGFISIVVLAIKVFSS